MDSGRKYKKALRYIDLLSSRNSNYAKVQSLKIDSLLNLAAVNLKISKNQEARHLCDQVRIIWVISYLVNCYLCIYILYISADLF